MMAAVPTKHDVFQAIADPTRRTILKLLTEKEMPLNVITGHFPITRGAVSKHLRILTESGLVRESRVGRETRYRFEGTTLNQLKDWLAYFDQFWDQKLAALKQHVESGTIKPKNKPDPKQA